MIEVRPFQPADGAAWLSVYRACLTHYAEPPASLEHERLMLEELAAPYGTFSDIAWLGDRPLGFACWMRVFPAGNSFAHYLKELYVTEEARGTGAGRALMRAMAARAEAAGAQSLRWETGEPDALQFYRTIGARDDGKTHFTVLPDQYSTLAR